MPDEILVVMNARSGALRSRAGREALQKALEEAELKASFAPVSRRAELVAAVEKRLERGGRIVVAAGGDGTVSAVAAALLGTGATLGVIPGGTLNHFARDLGIPENFAAAARILREGAVSNVDVAAVNGRTFLNNSSLGIYPRIVRHREEIQSRGFRKSVALVGASFKALMRPPALRLRLEIDGQTLDRVTSLVFVGNNFYEITGTRLGSRLRIDAGQLCVFAARSAEPAALVRTALQTLLRGFRQAAEMDFLCTQELWISVQARSVLVALDGEVVQLTPPLHYEIRPGVLRVLTPPRAPQ